MYEISHVPKQPSVSLNFQISPHDLVKAIQVSEEVIITYFPGWHYNYNVLSTSEDTSPA